MNEHQRYFAQFAVLAAEGLERAFHVVGVHGNTDAKYYPDPAKEAPLKKLAEYWNERADVKRDMVHIVTGHKFVMISIFCGGLLIAGLFTFVPGRIMHAVVFGN